MGGHDVGDLTLNVVDKDTEMGFGTGFVLNRWHEIWDEENKRYISGGINISEHPAMGL
jgi:hypothetical protein